MAERAADAVAPYAVPIDDADRQLLAAVRPEPWPDPPPRARYHMVVIGAGTGGLVAAAIAAGLGATVALIERNRMGGDCLNVGCVPSKAVIRASRAWADARSAAERFGGPRASGEGDFGAAMARMRRLRAGLAPVDSAARFRDLGVDVFFGDATFVGPDRVRVHDRELVFRRAVIAAGGRPAIPDLPGLRATKHLTNETIFGLTERPSRLVVIGAGAIGCELAQAFARFGSAVTVIDVGPRILTRCDADAARIVAESMQRDGVRLLLGTQLVGVESIGGGGVRVRGQQQGVDAAVEGDVLLVAAGRQPNVEGLGLERAGVAYGPRGITVDDHLRTTNPRVYAVGDVSSALQFTHLADFQARLAVQNALFFGRQRASRLIVPRVVYTSPELAEVGAMTGEAPDVGATYTVPMAEVDRAVLDGETEGFVRVRLAPGSDRIVGATIVGAHAGEMISEITLAMTGKLGLGTIGGTMHPYPTQAEGIRKVADRWRRGKLTPFVRRVFALFFRVVR